MNRSFRIFLISASVLLVASPAYAYVGLGAGLSAIGSLLAVIAAGILGLVGFIWYPIKRLLGMTRRKAEDVE